jgi:hypothetical protein
MSVQSVQKHSFELRDFLNHILEKDRYVPSESGPSHGVRSMSARAVRSSPSSRTI